GWRGSPLAAAPGPAAALREGVPAASRVSRGRVGVPTTTRKPYLLHRSYALERPPDPGRRLGRHPPAGERTPLLIRAVPADPELGSQWASVGPPSVWRACLDPSHLRRYNRGCTARWRRSIPMPLPSQNDSKLWLALLHEIDQAGGEARPADLYPRLRAYFPA